jgi:hypothetical protein
MTWAHRKDGNDNKNVYTKIMKSKRQTKTRIQLWKGLKDTGRFGRLSKRVWKKTKITLRKKILIYQACVLSTLLKGAETWTIYARQEKNCTALTCVFFSKL